MSMEGQVLIQSNSIGFALFNKRLTCNSENELESTRCNLSDKKAYIDGVMGSGLDVDGFDSIEQ